VRGTVLLVKIKQQQRPCREISDMVWDHSNEDLNLKLSLKLAALAIVSAAYQAPVWAQIKVGKTARYSGTAASSVKETATGAQLYLDHINAQGGVNGQKIELVSMDDKFDPALAAENAKKTNRRQQGDGVVFDAWHTPHRGHHALAVQCGHHVDCALYRSHVTAQSGASVGV
jgi:ATP phosphoribosyltransferase regulatory subunit HisZ